jgi:hypothetical protein
MKRAHSEVQQRSAVTVTNLKALQSALVAGDQAELSDDFSLGIMSYQSNLDFVSALQFVNTQLLSGPVPLFKHVIWWSNTNPMQLKLLFEILSSPNCPVEYLELNDFHLEKFLPQLHPNKNLTSLDLYRNYLDGSLLVKLLARSSITRLDLGSFSLENYIGFLENLSLCTSLKSLSIFASQPVPLGPFIILNTSITRLEAMITTPDGGLNIIKGNSVLKKLFLSMNLENNDETHKILTGICSEFEYNHSLVSFRLEFGDYLHIDSFGGLVKNTTLISLSVPATPKCICELLEGSNRITKLHAIVPANYDYDVLCKFVQNTTTVRRLELSEESEGYVSNSGAKFFSALLQNSSITFISIETCYTIDVETANLIASSLRVPEKLKGLDLAGSVIETEAFPILFNALLANNTLTLLSFSFSNIENESTESFEKYLWQTTTLKRLSLNNMHTTIGDKIMKPLMNNISVHTTVQGGSDPVTVKKFKCISQHNQGKLFEKYLICVEIRIRQGWPETHHQFTEEEKHVLLELVCCAFDIPTEVLSLIIHQMVILQHKRKTAETINTQ